MAGNGQFTPFLRTRMVGCRLVWPIIISASGTLGWVVSFALMASPTAALAVACSGWRCADGQTTLQAPPVVVALSVQPYPSLAMAAAASAASILFPNNLMKTPAEGYAKPYFSFAVAFYT